MKLLTNILFKEHAEMVTCTSQSAPLVRWAVRERGKCGVCTVHFTPIATLNTFNVRMTCTLYRPPRVFIALCSQSDPQYSKFQQLIHQQDQVQLALPLCLRYLKRYIYICLNVCFSNGRSRLWKLCLRWWSPSRLKCSASGKVAQSHVIDCAACQFLFPLLLFSSNF